MRFEGGVAVVSGAASGIGAATARRFAAEGAAVIVADIDDGKGSAVAASIGSDGGRAAYVHCDVSVPADWEALAQATHDRFGRVTVVVNNAYRIERRVAHEQSAADWDAQLAVNLRQIVHSLAAFVDDLRESRGAIVNTSSVHAYIGLPGSPAYSASKGGMLALTRQLAVDYAPEIRVNAVVPGAIDTPAWDGFDGEARAAFAAAIPAARFGTPEDVASVIAFLASREADYVTGAALVIDGGWSVAR
ncbi:MAG: glucose 1-dehydrogenase [Gaiellales bacterium]